MDLRRPASEKGAAPTPHGGDLKFIWWKVMDLEAQITQLKEEVSSGGGVGGRKLDAKSKGGDHRWTPIPPSPTSRTFRCIAARASKV